MRFFSPRLILALLLIPGPIVGAAECGWEWCACKGQLARALLESPSGATGADPKYAPDREIDVSHVKLELDPDFRARSLDGVVTHWFSPIAKSLRELRLDAIDLEILEVKSSREIENWVAGETELTIAFVDPIPVDAETTIEIRYRVFPEHGWYFRTAEMGYPEGDDHFFTQGEPQRHSYWFPGYDYPNERFTSEVICRVPEGMTVLSNGRLVEEKTVNGVSSFHWKQEKEHVNYLISVVGGYFRHLEGTHGDLPLAFYTPPSYFAEAANSFRDTAKILPFFEKEIGHAYPWAKYYNVCVADFLAGGMENTSVTTLTTGTLFSDDSENLRSSHGLDAHEIAHQWFGNLVTCRDWSHLWLNEGFATYYTHLYEGEKNGLDAMRYDLFQDAQRLLENTDTRPIVWRGYSDPMEQFDYRAYPKGSWVLHMLRSAIGPELFRECIHTYLERNRNETVVTADLAEVFEDLTGRSWDRFFDQWVYHGGTPRVKVSYSWDQGRKQAKFRFEQVQKTGDRVMLFHLDVPIRMISEEGKTTEHVVELRGQAEDFYISLPGNPKIVRIDPDLTLLAKFDFQPSNPLLHAQLENADDMIGRLLATGQLGGRKDLASLDKLRSILEKDPFYGVRIEAARALAKTHTPEALERLISGMDQGDARVRQAVVVAIGKFFRPEALAVLKTVLEGEQNPLIVTEAVRALGKFPNEEVESVLVEALARESYQHQVADSVIDAIRLQGDPKHLALVQDHLSENSSRFRTRDLGSALDTLAFLARDEDPEERESIRDFLCTYLVDPRDSLRTAVIRALGTLGDPRSIPLLQTFVDAGNKGSSDFEAAESSIRKLNEDKKQAVEVKDLRREVTELQKGLREMQAKLETMEKQEAAKKESAQ